MADTRCCGNAGGWCAMPVLACCEEKAGEDKQSVLNRFEL